MFLSRIASAYFKSSLAADNDDDDDDDDGDDAEEARLAKPPEGRDSRLERMKLRVVKFCCFSS